MIGSVVYPTLADSDEEFLVYMMGIELNRLCRNLGRANREMRRALRRGDHQAAWFSLDALLRAAASISRIFWPPNSKYAGRAKLLGRLFHVGRRSPFALRDVRNSFEHFDERIEDWLASGRHLLMTLTSARRAPAFGTCDISIRPQGKLHTSTEACIPIGWLRRLLV